MCVTLAFLQISEYLIKLSCPEIYTTPEDQKFGGREGGIYTGRNSECS